MPQFNYRALDADSRLVTGELVADGVQEAIAQLEANGLAVQSIGYATAEAPLGKPIGAAAAAAAGGFRVDAESEQAALRAHLATVLERGQAITPALRAYAEEMPSGRRRRELLAVCRILERGDASDAARSFAALPEYWIPLLSSATASTDPGRILREFLTESQRADELRRQWRRTLGYPLVVMIIAVAVLAVLSFMVIPTFEEVFRDFGLVLPVVTRWVLTISQFITSGAALGTAIVLVAVSLVLVNARRVLPAPVASWLGDRLGSIAGRSAAKAQFIRFTADLMAAGVDAPGGLRIAAYASRRPTLQRAGRDLADEIRFGEAVSPSRRGPLPATLVYALQADAPQASRIRLLMELSASFAERARSRLSWTHGILGPFAICVVGGVVGLVVLALMMPLVQLINNLSG